MPGRESDGDGGDGGDDYPTTLLNSYGYKVKQNIGLVQGSTALDQKSSDMHPKSVLEAILASLGAIMALRANKAPKKCFRSSPSPLESQIWAQNQLKMYVKGHPRAESSNSSFGWWSAESSNGSPNSFFLY